MRNYLLASWLLFYDSTFRPRRFQQRLNEWLPPKEGADTDWTATVWLPANRTAWWLVSLGLPWWLAGIVLLWGLGWPAFSPFTLLLLSLGLLFSGWGVTVLWPNLGLLWPALGALGVAFNPGLETQLLTSWQDVAVHLSWQQGLPLVLILSVSLGLGGGGGYLVLAPQRRWWSALVLGPLFSLGGGGLAILLAPWLGVDRYPSPIMAALVAVVVAVVVAGIVAAGVAAVVTEEEDRMTNIAADTTGFVAFSVAASVAFGVAFSVAASVAFGVAGFVAGFVAFSVACFAAFSMTFSVAVSVAVIVAGFLAFGVTGVLIGGVAGFVGFGIAIGVAVVVAGFVAVGVAGWALLPWGLYGGMGLLLGLLAARWRRRWAGGLVILAVAALRLENFGSLDALLSGLLALLGYSHILFIPLSQWRGRAAYRRLQPPNSLLMTGVYRLVTWWGPPPPAAAPQVDRIALVQTLPPFRDELVWTRVPHLDQLLTAAAGQDRARGLVLTAEVAASRYQNWAAAPAYAQITANALAACPTVEALPAAVRQIDWLPDTPEALGEDFAAVWPRLLAISQDVAVALEAGEAGNLYSRRLGLDQARESLARLRPSLPPLGRAAMQRWQPVVDSWLALLDEQLAQPLLPEGQMLINPYDAGNPLNLRRAALFRGREGLVAAVATALLERNRPTLVLHGPRRMGKTSFLLQLPRLLGGSVIPVFVDLQRPGSTGSSADFLFAVARTLVTEAQLHKKLRLPHPERRAFERRPFAAFADWLDGEIIPTLATSGDFTLLLCFDEFEKLGQAIAQGQLDTRLLDELRHTIQHREAVSVLFAGVQTLEDLGPNWSSYFISVRPLQIPYLTPEEAAGLIRNPDPQSGFNLQYEAPAVERIIDVTRCHPYLVQLVCSAVVNQANQARTLLATPDLVAAAETAALEMGEPYFRNLWDETSGATPKMIAAGRALLRQVALANGPLLLSPETAAARQSLNRLVRYKVLEKTAGGYQFEVALVRRWVAERAPML